jgi:3-carboxy-cis,cis-muconate cycloisomerase
VATPVSKQSSSPSPRDGFQALLDVEAALARAKAELGRIPGESGAAIAEACRAELYDRDAIAEAALEHATIVVPLVEAIRARLPEELRDTVHRPATSQDIIDSALMLEVARALDLLAPGLEDCTDAIRALKSDHGDTPCLARTLLQPALPTTFGTLLDAWLGGLHDAAVHVFAVREHGLAVQLAGPIADLDDPELVGVFAAELGLAVPERPWHTSRARIAHLAAALGIVVGALGKIAADVILLSQAEIGELAEGGAGGRSSAMPHKRNPARAVQIAALAQRAPGLIATVFAGLPQELYRAPGRWQAEGPVVRELLDLAEEAVEHAQILLDGLRIDPERMKANLR